MSKHWLFGVNSLWCRIVSFLGFPEWCFLRPTKYKDRVVSEIKVFTKSEHKVKVNIEPIPDMHAGFLGFFLWFVNLAWTDMDEAVRLARETFHEIRIRGFSVVDWFMWLSDGDQEHAHLNLKAPFVYDSGFKLDQMNSKYWDIYRRFIELHKEFDLHPCPQVFMYGYCWEPFKSNGLDFFDTESHSYQRQVTHNALDTIKDVFGNDYKPWVKMLNEGRHRNKDGFHKLGKWHEIMWKTVASFYTDISHFVVDVSLSEGCQIYLNEPALCGKPYNDQCIHGDPNHDRSDVTKSILAETHSVNTVEDLLEPRETLHFLKSKWRRYKLHGDGGKTGSQKLADTNFAQGNADEVYEMCKYLWTQAKRKNKQAIYSLFPKESFRDNLGNWNLWFENYRVDNIFWDRADAVLRAWNDVYG